MKYKKYKIPILFGNLIVVITNNFEKSAKKLKLTISTPSKGYAGFTRRIEEDSTYIVFIKTKHSKDMSTIAHEALHITNYVFEDAGIELSLTNDEMQAYFLGWVVNKIQKTIES